MSLQVWLPLNKDIHNQGLLDLPTPWSFWNKETSGKIGECYTDGAIYHIDNEWLDNTWSLACWVKSTGWSQNNDIILCKNVSASTSSQFYFSIINGSQLNLGVNGGSGVTSYNYTFSTNTWYHIAATYDGTTICLYINGNQVKKVSYSSTKLTGMNNLCIGCRSTNTAGTTSTGNNNKKLNDIRIYNHVLSPKEVEEISKGLVLHYKLDQPNLINKNTLTSGQYINNTGGLKATSNWYASDYIPIYPGNTYQTVDLSHGGSNTCIALYDSAQTFTRSFTIIANENLTITAADNEYFIRISIRNIDNELLQAAFCELPLIIYDSSGYGNNGIINNITMTNISPRYSLASTFNGTNSYIKVIDNNWFGQNTSELTINLWAKSSAWAGTRLFSCTESGGFNTEAGNSGYLRFPIYVCTNEAQTSYAYKYDGQELKISDLSTTDWNMITFVYNHEGTKTYINGELHHTYSNISYGIHFNTSARLFLGCEANGANAYQPWFNGQESDFRIYATALSTEQIKELYNTSMSIDSSGNIHAREVIEI